MPPRHATPRPEAFRHYVKADHGPITAVYRHIADDPAKVAELDHVRADLGRCHDHGTGSTVMDREYLLLTARRSG